MQVINDSNFADQTTSGLVLVDFFADWCGPCKMLTPILEQMAPSYEGKVTFVKVNVDESQESAQKYNITSIPTLLLLKDGSEIDRKQGFQSQDMLTQFLNGHLE